MFNATDGIPFSAEELAALPVGVRLFLDQCVRQVGELRSEIAALRADNAGLRAQLAGVKKTPQNSSVPPSSQHPHAKPPRRKSKSKKKRGGQPGHPRHQRKLIPTEDCQEVVAAKPSECRRCGEALTGDDPDPYRHQIWEVPKIEPLVTEYQRHRLVCPGCGETTCGDLPPGVPQSQAGPRLVALVVLLMGTFRQSKRRVALFLEQVLGQPCSPGWVVKLQNQGTAALRPCYTEVIQALPAEPIVGIDETPHKEGLVKNWLWAFVGSISTAFVLRPTRAATVLGEVLGSQFTGVVNCDRAKMYYCMGRLQWCWAHLKRDFQALIDSSDGQVKCLGRDLMRPTLRMFEVWANYRDGTLSRRKFKELMQPIRQEVEAFLLRGEFSGNPRLQGMCGPLYDHRDWLWTFVEVKGVGPTNNGSERALRHGVIWRKLSFGTQSAAGSRFVETILTVHETCRQQKRKVMDFVTTAIQAYFVGSPAPSLLPRA